MPKHPTPHTPPRPPLKREPIMPKHEKPPTEYEKTEHLRGLADLIREEHERDQQKQAEPKPKPEPPPKPLVYCSECVNFRFTKQSAEIGFQPLCAAVQKPGVYLAPSGPLAYEECRAVNADGHCQYYIARQNSNPGFWVWIFGG